MTKRKYKVEIDDTIYKFELMKAKKAIRIGFKLNSLILPTVGAAVDGMKQDEFVHGAPTTFKDAANLIVEKLGSLEVEDLIEEMFEDCTIDGDEIDFDEHFQGNLGDVLTCLEVILKENFSSLFTKKTTDMLGKLTNLL